MADEDIVALLVSYLDGVTATDVRVATRVPDPRPAKLVQVRLVSWPKLPPVRRIARAAITCWGADVGDEAGAMALGIEVRGHINALIGTALLGPMVYRVEETSGVHPDEDTETHVAQADALYAITHRDDGVIR